MTSILDAVKGKKRIGIGGHVRPDGDCIGSTLAVYNYLCDNVSDFIFCSSSGALEIE